MGDLIVRFRRVGNTQLPLQVIGQRCFGSQRIFKGRIFSDLFRDVGSVTEIKIVAEKSFVIEGIFYFSIVLDVCIFFGDLHLFFSIVLFIFLGGDLFFQDRIDLHFLRKIILELQSSERKEFDCLLQRRGHVQAGANLQMKLLLNRHKT